MSKIVFRSEVSDITKKIRPETKIAKSAYSHLYPIVNTTVYVKNALRPIPAASAWVVCYISH